MTSVNAQRTLWDVFSAAVFFGAFMLGMAVTFGIPYLIFQASEIAGVMSVLVFIPVSLAGVLTFLRYWLDYTDKKDREYRQRTIRIEPMNLGNVKDPEAFRAAIEKTERTNSRVA